MEQFWQIFWTVAGIVVTGLASWLVTVITGYFNSKIKDKTIQQHATNLMTIVKNAVMQTTQTYVSVMKKNGKWTNESQNEAFEKCMNIIKSQLTSDLKDYITNNFGDIESYLTTLIESTIFSTK